MLTGSQLERFVTDGFVALRGAVPGDVVRACRAELDAELLRRGVDPAQPSTWTEPVVRFWTPETAPFAAAGTQPVLLEAYDQLIGPGRRIERAAVGGSVPVRFPSAVDPGDAGWHIDGSIPIGDTWGVSVRSHNRGLLCLFLFSDVGPSDAPTELKVGSHRLVPPALVPLGDAGGLFAVHESEVFPAIMDLPSALATGDAGDVFVCHPFLVHTATWPHRGTSPRYLAQPEIRIHTPFELAGGGPIFPVERAILAGLGAEELAALNG